jgi:hypothetical protein
LKKAVDGRARAAGFAIAVSPSTNGCIIPRVIFNDPWYDSIKSYLALERDDIKMNRSRFILMSESPSRNILEADSDMGWNREAVPSHVIRL